MAEMPNRGDGGRGSLHETSTPVQLYKRQSNPLPYARAAAKAFSSARLDPLRPVPFERPRNPSSRGPMTSLDAIERPRGGA